MIAIVIMQYIIYNLAFFFFYSDASLNNIDKFILPGN